MKINIKNRFSFIKARQLKLLTALGFALIMIFTGFSELQNASADHIPGHVGEEHPGSLAILPIIGTVDDSMTVSGVGAGGYWRRGRVRCHDTYGQDDGDAHAYFPQYMSNIVPQPINPTPPEYHNHPNPLPNHPTRYKIDGQDAGPYTLNMTYEGMNVPIECYPRSGEDVAEFAFNFVVDTSGLSNGVHTISVDAYDESTAVILEASTTFTVLHANATMNCTTTQYVEQGDPAIFPIGAIVDPAFNSDISVTMTDPPVGPTNPRMLNSPLILRQSTGYAGLAQVGTTNVPMGQYDLTFTGTSGTLTSSCIARLVVSQNEVSADIKFSGESATNSDGPVTIRDDTGGLISWETSNADSCTSSTIPDVPEWPDGQNVSPVNSPYPSGTSIGSLRGPQTFRFILTCINGSGSAVDFVDVIVGDTPAPTVDLRCDGGPPVVERGTDDEKNGDGGKAGADGGDGGKGEYREPEEGVCYVDYNTPGLLAWDSTDAAYCNLSPTLDPQDPEGYVLPASPGTNTWNLTSDTIFTAYCTGPGGRSSNDQVEIRVNVNTQTYTMSCSQTSVSIPTNSGADYLVQTVAVDGFSSPVTLTANVTDIGGVAQTDATLPAVTFPTNGLTPSASYYPHVTSAGVAPSTYRIDFIGNGVGVTRTSSCNLVVTAPSPVGAPTITLSNRRCGTVDITWTASGTSGYKVYRGTSIASLIPTNSGTLISGPDNINPFPRKFTDNSPGASNNYYKVIAFTGTTPSPGIPYQNIKGPIGSLSCSPNYAPSDKDLVSVNGKIDKNFNPVACNGTSDVASLPANALYSAGDVVTFKINVCNAGPGNLTGVYVVDYLKNNLTDPVDYEFTPSNCASLDNYDASTRTLSFGVQDVNYPEGGIDLMGVCSIEFAATVTAPSLTTAGIYRFQNIADIYADEILNNPYYRVLTPPYLFSIGGGVPDRNESAPQSDGGCGTSCN